MLFTGLCSRLGRHTRPTLRPASALKMIPRCGSRFQTSKLVDVFSVPQTYPAICFVSTSSTPGFVRSPKRAIAYHHSPLKLFVGMTLITVSTYDRQLRAVWAEIIAEISRPRPLPPPSPPWPYSFSRPSRTEFLRELCGVRVVGDWLRRGQPVLLL
jgi:hypothetical protein